LDAVSLRIAEQYINAFGRLAQKGNTVLLPANVGDPSAMVAQALSVFDSIRRSEGQRSASAAAVEVEEDSLPTNTEQSFGGELLLHCAARCRLLLCCHSRPALLPLPQPSSPPARR
jgi:hypothetical protein